MKLVAYLDGSPVSGAAREFLKKHSIEFEEVDATTSEGALRLRKRTQQPRVPAFEMKRSHSIHVVAGFDNFARRILSQELGLDKTIQKTLF